MLTPIEKVLPAESKLRKENKQILADLQQATTALSAQDGAAAEVQIPVIETLKAQLGELKHLADQHQSALDARSPIVSSDDIAFDLPATADALLTAADLKLKELNESARVNTIAPEIQLITQALEQQPAEVPSNLNEQQAALEDLSLQKTRLEALMKEIPETEQGEELRQKSEYNLDRLKDLLRQLGEKVGDKLSALAAFNTARKDAEDQLLVVTSRPESDAPAEQVIDQLKKDEENLLAVRVNIEQVNRDSLDEQQLNEYNELLLRLAKAEELISVSDLKIFIYFLFKTALQFIKKANYKTNFAYSRIAVAKSKMN